MPKLLRLHSKSLLDIRGVGRHYAGLICAWQRQARLSDEVEYVGPMILEDARRLLALVDAIKALEGEIDQQAAQVRVRSAYRHDPGLWLGVQRQIGW